MIGSVSQYPTYLACHHRTAGYPAFIRYHPVPSTQYPHLLSRGQLQEVQKNLRTLLNNPEEVCHRRTTQVPLAAPFTEVTDSQTAFRKPCFGAASFQDDDIHMQVTNKQLAHSEQATLFT